MPVPSPFIDQKTGRISFPDNSSLVRHVERWAKMRGDRLAYRYLDFSTERDGVYKDLAWSRFSARNRAVGARLQQVTKPGDRVAILAPQGLDYMVAFYGALYAGAIAVPLFDPAEPGHTGRLHSVLGDCAPSVILTTADSADGVRKFFRQDRPANERPRVIAVDAIPDEVAETWEPIVADPDDIAYLQYTSGSTRAPAGVKITHRAVATNLAQLITSLQVEEGQRGVMWLPLFHDMGLVTAMVPSVVGHCITIMSPTAFVRRPSRWIRELAVQPDDDGPTFSAAPNFAFEHAALRGLPKDGEPELDLSNVFALLNGSEPVSTASMRKFNEAFAPYGLPATAIKPSYGMAEATLFVSTTDMKRTATTIYVDRDELGRGRFQIVADAAPTAVAQVSSGVVAIDQWAAIVDSATAAEQPDGHVGEIWLHGNNIGAGYWGRDRDSEETFGNTLTSRATPSHTEGVPDDGRWMRTGDYGAYFGGELYVTGRVKDMVIIDGRNHYPQDLEYTAQEASSALRAGYVAAFSVPANQLPSQVFDVDPEDSSEQLVIVGERTPGAHKSDIGSIVDDIRAAIAVRHGVTARDVILVPAGAIPRTSSGKVGHAACRAAYLDGSLRGGYVTT
ncbi:long-chain-fatty-acid--AMP ligase FadD32 [Mycobacterium cookii]|uniref:Acyl-AMP synthetase n=1 Tax=Mycobacterium cookii TaxID=1775 RepID=A0A7I7KYA0_9MYCO|nr:long-chain-fatty-acid--AMP ligase FadD32 [Mycobacterium cookii]MCV7332903.1 AMP-binding protein [Mycobacterium cookii]BBX46292.1 long-chain-fatty-acid--AMP ligase FadD32 [Mycobacterium cookii]